VIDGAFYLDPLVDDVIFGIEIQRAPKEPRTVLMRGNKLLVMAFKGGHALPGETETIHDLDLWCADVDSLETSYHGGLGSTNFNMAFAGNGDLFLVGGEAQNHLVFEKNVAAAPTGFVESTFYYVKNPCTPSFDFQVRDVNLELGPIALPAPVFADPSKAVQGPIQTEPQLVPQPVKKRDALAQPTDVVPYEPDGTVTKVFFTAFGSDRIGVIVPVFGTDPNEWDLDRINLRLQGGPVRGPRGLAVKYANDEDPGDAGNRLYVANRFDQSVTIIDPDTESVLENFGLAADPRPDHLVEGQPFLYDARLSGNGFSSCASCHYDARTDKTRWHLGIDPDDPDAPEPQQIPPLLIDGLAFDPEDPPDFPLDKGFIVTQTLQGLLNWDVEPEFQELFTNAPYHWRGDRATFLDFNPAFEGLLGGSQLAPADMEKFRTFINTIHVGSNPQQPLGRRFSGTFGDPGVPIADDDTATGGQRGLRLFMSAKTVGQKSCVTCHTLHEASNNRITEAIGASLVNGGFPAETAQMRSLLQREARLEAGPASEPNLSPVTGREGLFHDGDPSLVLTPTINGFNRTFFLAALCPDDQPGTEDDFDCENLVELNRASHQLDWGLAPIAALAYTVTAANLSDQLTNLAFRVLEDEADKANIGFAVQVFANGQQTGYTYVPGESPPYVRQPVTAGPAVGQQDIRNLATGDVRVVLAAAPVGSERRLASPTGVASTPVSNPPADIRLLPMKPSEPYKDVPKLTENWDDFDNQGLANPMLSVHTKRLYQFGLQQDAASENGFGFGLGPLHHDVPRRFQVVARNVEPGAELCLWVPNTSTPPDVTMTPEQQGTDNFIKIVLPIHPIDDGGTLAEGEKKWETAVELEPIFYYAMMLGGFEAPGVKKAAEDLTFLISDPPPVGFFDPIPRNFHYVEIVNPDDDGTGNKTGDGGWQRLTLSPP
jgi:YVTN family beta-propeller protein